MPIYDWVCSHCGFHIEELLSMQDCGKYNDVECQQCKIGVMLKVLDSSIKIAMRPHEADSRKKKHQQRIADKVKNIQEKKRKGTL